MFFIFCDILLLEAQNWSKEKQYSQSSQIKVIWGVRVCAHVIRYMYMSGIQGHMYVCGSQRIPSSIVP